MPAESKTTAKYNTASGENIVAQLVVIEGEKTWWLFLSDAPIPDPFVTGDMRGWYLYPDAVIPGTNAALPTSDRIFHREFASGKDSVPAWGVIARDVPLSAVPPPRKDAWGLKPSDRAFCQQVYSDFIAKEKMEQEAARLAAKQAKERRKAEEAEDDVPFGDKFGDILGQGDTINGWTVRTTGENRNRNNNSDDSKKKNNILYTAVARIPKSVQEMSSVGDIIIVCESRESFGLVNNDDDDDANSQQEQQWSRTIYVPTAPSPLTTQLVLSTDAAVHGGGGGGDSSQQQQQAHQTAAAAASGSGAGGKKNSSSSSSSSSCVLRSLVDFASDPLRGREELFDLGAVFVALRRGTCNAALAIDEKAGFMLHDIEASAVSPFFGGGASSKKNNGKQTTSVAPPSEAITVDATVMSELRESALNVGKAVVARKMQLQQASKKSSKKTKAAAASAKKKKLPLRRGRDSDDDSSDSSNSSDDDDDDDDDSSSSDDDEDDDDESSVSTVEDENDRDFGAKKKKKPSSTTKKATAGGEAKKKKTPTTTTKAANKKSAAQTKTTTTTATTKKTSGRPRRPLSALLDDLEPAVSVTTLPTAATAVNNNNNNNKNNNNKNKNAAGNDSNKTKLSEEQVRERVEVEKMTAMAALLEDVEASVKAAATEVPSAYGGGHSVVPDFS